jgi:hypothetical protein
MAKPEIYVSVDIEADGPIPGVNSMLNLGMAAFRLGSDEPIDTLEVNIARLPNAQQDPDTMAFWAKNPEAWGYVTRDPLDPYEAMQKVCAWAEALPGKPVMVVYPTYDFMFVRWYLVRFCGADRARVFGFQALDIKTLAMSAMGSTFKGVSKRAMSKAHPEWFTGQPPHDHTGLADAIGQGMLFVRIMRTLEERRGV